MFNELNPTEHKSLLNYLDTDERATLVDIESDSDSMSPRRRRRSKRKSSRRRKTVRRGLKGVRVTKGRINLKIAGYSGIQKLGASELIHYIPLSKLKAAAKRVLKRAGVKKTRQRRRRRVKRRK